VLFRDNFLHWALIAERSVIGIRQKNEVTFGFGRGGFRGRGGERKKTARGKEGEEQNEVVK
jgi:hypothetical protein